MIAISNDFKTAMKQPIKELDAYIELDEDNKITSADDLISFKLSCDTGMCKTAMRKLECKYLGEHNLLDQWVQVGFGVKLSNGTFEYLDYGSFLVTEIAIAKDTGVTTIVGYDKMINSMTKYSKLDVEYPISLYDYTDLLCDKCGLILGNETFTHADWLINGELWENISGITYRDILVQIAQVTASTCIISNDDRVYFKSISNTNEQLTYANMKKLKLEPLYGEINSVVLARDPITGEDVFLKDDDSIEINGLTEFKISNNEIIDKDRENAITPIYNALHGMSYYPFETTTEGLGWYEIADSFDIVDNNGDVFNTSLFNFSLTIDGGIKEILKTVAETKTQTQYQYATTIAKRVKNTEIIVNKQQGEIELLVEEVKQSGIPRYAEAPENPKEEDIYLNTTDNIIYVYKDGKWNATSIDPSTLEDYWTKEETATKIEQTAEQINMSVTNNQEDIESLKSETSNLKQTVDSLQFNISKVGGINLLENSSFQNKFNKWLNTDIKILYIGDTLPEGQCVYWYNTKEQFYVDGNLPIGMYYCRFVPSRGLWIYVPTIKTKEEIIKMFEAPLTSNVIEVPNSISNYGLNIHSKYISGDNFREGVITHVPFKLKQTNKLYLSVRGFGSIDYGNVKVKLLLLDGDYSTYVENYNSLENISQHIVKSYDLDIFQLSDNYSKDTIEIQIDDDINYTEATIQIELVDKKVIEIPNLNWRSETEGELAIISDTSLIKNVYKSLFKTVNVTYIESVNDLTNPKEEIFWFDIINSKMKRYVYHLTKVGPSIEWIGNWEDTTITKEEIEKGYKISIFDRWALTEKTSEDFDETMIGNYLKFDGVVNLFEMMLSTENLEWQPASGENFWGKNFKFSGDGLYIENSVTGYNRVIDADEDTAKNSSGTITWQLTPSGALVQDLEAKGKIKHGRIITVPRDDGNHYYYV